MRIVLQRVHHATVSVTGKMVATIGRGITLLIGISQEDRADLFPGIAFWWVFPGQMFNKLSYFTAIEPQPVFPTAHVDEYLWLPAYGCLFHFMATNGALSLLLR